MNKLFAFSLLAALVSLSPAVADAPKMAFEASYECKGPGGTSTMHMVSDGKGHLRTDTDAGNQKVTTLVDYPAKNATTLIISSKMALKTKLQETNEVNDAESAKRAKAKDLGLKDIDGHKCHGFEYNTAQATQQVWIGEDTHYLVHSETQLKSGQKMTTALKSWSTKAPAADSFTIPAGFKEMNMPTATFKPQHH